MINTNSKFEEDNLLITFSGESIETKAIVISIKDDVDYKELIDFLVYLIPNEQELKIEFEAFETVDKKEKLDLINETTTEILEHFNNSIKSLKGIKNLPNAEDKTSSQEKESAAMTTKVPDDDLPF